MKQRPNAFANPTSHHELVEHRATIQAHIRSYTHVRTGIRAYPHAHTHTHSCTLEHVTACTLQYYDAQERVQPNEDMTQCPNEDFFLCVHPILVSALHNANNTEAEHCAPTRIASTSEAYWTTLQHPTKLKISSDGCCCLHDLPLDLLQQLSINSRIWIPVSGAAWIFITLVSRIVTFVICLFTDPANTLTSA